MYERAKNLSLKLYHMHYVRYLFVGGSTFILQSGLLLFLHGVEHVNLPIATSMSYWTSIIYNFCLNRWWTFSATDNKNLRKHITTYGSLLLFNYAFVVIFVHFVSHRVNYAVANGLAVLLQMSWNYFIYKNYIFKKHEDTNVDTKATTSIV